MKDTAFMNSSLRMPRHMLAAFKPNGSEGQRLERPEPLLATVWTTAHEVSVADRKIEFGERLRQRHGVDGHISYPALRGTNGRLGPAHVNEPAFDPAGQPAVVMPTKTFELRRLNSRPLPPSTM